MAVESDVSGGIVVLIANTLNGNAAQGGHGGTGGLGGSGPLALVFGGSGIVTRTGTGEAVLRPSADGGGSGHQHRGGWRRRRQLERPALVGAFTFPAER